MRRALLAVLMATAAILVAAAPADAGGPTSVLLTNPGQSLAAALYASDPRYAELETLLHGDSSAESGAGEPPGAAGATYLNVTWLAHDVSVWRTDQLRLDKSGEGWIATWHDLGEEMSSDGPSWERLDDVDRVRRLVASLDLLGAGEARAVAGDAAVTVPDVGSEAPPARAPAPRPAVVEETRWFTLTGWRWAVPGLLLGIAIAFLVPGRRAGLARPRQELVDRSPERVTTPG